MDTNSIFLIVYGSFSDGRCQKDDGQSDGNVVNMEHYHDDEHEDECNDECAHEDRNKVAKQVVFNMPNGTVNWIFNL